MVASMFPLTLSQACVKKRGKTLLGPVDMVVERQGFTIVLGPNGSGKTTLLRTLHGMERLSTGQINWAISEPETRSCQAFVFQAPIMLRRSVQDNLAYPLILHGMPKAEAREKAVQAAQQIGLHEALAQNASQLSGGEKQKLALARALIRKPEILFLDEPCSNLDGRATRAIETTLLQAYAAGTRIVMTTHDLGQARRLASDIVFLLHGKIHETALAQVFFETPQTNEARAFMDGDIVE